MYKTKFKLFNFVLAILLFLPIFSFGQFGGDLPTDEELNLPHYYYSSPIRPLFSTGFLESELLIDKISDKVKDEALKAGDAFRLDRLFFKADSDEIQSISFTMLNELAQAIKERDDIKKIEIGGFTNGLPPTNYCDQLSEARAEQVYEYLISKNVDADRLAYKGYGKRQPIAGDKTPEGRQLNQRVEIKILDLD
ncbi:MAG: hypothetical protein Sapg2KO_36410 [Saprospiraceae bacterium]